MKELELKDISGYLQHKLKARVLDDEKRVKIAIGDVVALHSCQEYDTAVVRYVTDYCDYYDDYEECLDRVLPILRPRSDMYKPIPHNGEMFAPIVECAKKIFKGTEWKVCEKVADGLIQFVEVERRNGKFLLQFWYDLGQFRIYHTEKNAEMHCGQVELFDYLNELKIDYRGLIDEGLAIDCNTLKINPYK